MVNVDDVEDVAMDHDVSNFHRSIGFSLTYVNENRGLRNSLFGHLRPLLYFQLFLLSLVH